MSQYVPIYSTPGGAAGAAGATGATGATGTGSASIVEAQLSGSHSAGVTTLNLDRSRPVPFATGTYVIIEPFSTNAEIRRITGGGASSLTVAATSNLHASGTIVFAFAGGLVPWSWWGAVPGDTAAASTNVTAFNNLTNQLYGLGNFYYGGIFVPPGVWYIDNELRMERDQILQGSSVLNAKIMAHSTFSFASVEVAMLHPYRDGSPVTFATSGPSARWGLRNIWFDGNNVTGSNGVLSSPQQPDSWENVRVDNCKGYGAAVSDVQQHVIKNFEAINCGISLRLRDSGFVWVDGFNSENADTNDCLIDCSSGGSFHHIHFENFHIENLDGTTHFKIDSTGTSDDPTGLVWNHGWFSTDGTKKMFEFNDAGNVAEYALRDVRCYGTPTNVIAVSDAARSLSLNARDRFADRIHDYRAKISSFSTAANIHGQHSYQVEGPDGGGVRMGAPKGTGSQPVSGFWSNQVNDNERHARYYSSGTLVWEVATDGSTKIGSAGSYVKSIVVGSTTWDPGSIADGAIASTTVTVTGAATNMPCFATFTSLVAGWIITAICTASDTVTVTIMNKTGGAVDLANGTVRACQVKF